MQSIQRIIVLGGGSAGLLAAVAVKAKVPGISVVVIRSKEIGVIGVGEGGTISLWHFLHEYIKVGWKKFFQTVQPSWKLGLKFTNWGPRDAFYYGFGTGPEHRYEGLSRPVGFYCGDEPQYADPIAAVMAHDKSFERKPDGAPALHGSTSYHLENVRFVAYLEAYASALGVEIVDDSVIHVDQNDAGVSGLRLKSGRTETADLYIDSSGFASLLLSKTLAEPFVSFRSTLFNHRAVTGGWARPQDVIKPYTTCEAMDSGWCWQIDHPDLVNRGYVYCPDFISDDQAEREFRDKNPLLGDTRIIRFVSGRYERSWVKNVVGIGNASGFVEPLEATALGLICSQSSLLANTLGDSDRQPSTSQIELFNRSHAFQWDAIRAFLSIHYKFNAHIQTPFWNACRADLEVPPIAAGIVDYFRENGPSTLYSRMLLNPQDQFGMRGYLALLLGQCVPSRREFVPTDFELRRWQQIRQRNKDIALKAMNVREALAVLHSPRWRWIDP